MGGLFDGTGKMRSDGMISRSVTILKPIVKYVYNQLKADHNPDKKLWKRL